MDIYIRLSVKKNLLRLEYALTRYFKGKKMEQPFGYSELSFLRHLDASDVFTFNAER